MAALANVTRSVAAMGASLVSAIACAAANAQTEGTETGVVVAATVTSASSPRDRLSGRTSDMRERCAFFLICERYHSRQSILRFEHSPTDELHDAFDGNDKYSDIL